MKLSAKRELATAILETYKIRAASYDAKSNTHKTLWAAAAAKACKDPDLFSIVGAMCCSEYVDFPEWAERVLGVGEKAHAA